MCSFKRTHFDSFRKVINQAFEFCVIDFPASVSFSNVQRILRDLYSPQSVEDTIVMDAFTVCCLTLVGSFENEFK